MGGAMVVDDVFGIWNLGFCNGLGAERNIMCESWREEELGGGQGRMPEVDFCFVEIG